MKVLLKEDIESLGYAGEVCKVANGFGRNYLLPNGLAEVATPSAMKKAESWRKRAETSREEKRAEYDLLSEKIEAVEMEFTARAGDTGRLYGSVTTQAITDKLNELLGTSIDRRVVGKEPLRQLGLHKVMVVLDRDHKPEISVMLKSVDGLVEAALEQREIEAAEALAAGDLVVEGLMEENLDAFDAMMAAVDEADEAESVEAEAEPAFEDEA